MKKSMKRIVSLLCLLCVLVGCLPVKTYATDGAGNTGNDIIITCNDSEKVEFSGSWRTTAWSKVKPTEDPYKSGVEGLFNDGDNTYRNSDGAEVKFNLADYSGKYNLYFLNLKTGTTANTATGLSTGTFSFQNGDTVVEKTEFDPIVNANGAWILVGTYELISESALYVSNSNKVTNFRVAAIKLVPVAEEPNVVVTGVSINNGESVSVEAGKTVTLTATVTPDNATDKTVTWTSTDDTVATVDENGTVTAKAVGSATITATTTNGKSATCAVTVTAAQTEETVYSVNDDATLQAAIDTATEGDTIKLLADIEYNSQLAIGEGITLDLNGKTLTAPGAATIKGYVVDNSEDKKGLLKVPKDQFAFINETNNPQMPVYNNDTDGYVFVTITDQNYGSTISENSFKLIFRPSFGTDETAKNTLLASGGEAAGISIGLCLYWTEDDVETSQVLVYGKDAYDVDMVATVYSSQNKAFYIDATGTNNFDNLKVAPYIKSATGVVWNGTPIPVNSTN